MVLLGAATALDGRFWWCCIATWQEIADGSSSSWSRRRGIWFVVGGRLAVGGSSQRSNSVFFTYHVDLTRHTVAKPGNDALIFVIHLPPLL